MCLIVLCSSWSLCKNKLVVSTTEWLPWLQRSWRDIGYEKFCKKHNITVPESLKWGPSGWDGVAVLESSEVRLVVDLSIHIDRQLTERRPDLVAYYQEPRRIVIFEVACTWEPLIKQRQCEKCGKYRELAADFHEVLCSAVRILRRHLSNDER